MIVAVVTVGVMEAPINQVVHMIPVGYRLMAAPGAMFMVRTTTLNRGTLSGVGLIHRDHMLIHMIPVRVVEVTVVEVIHMIVMADGSVAAVRAMLVGMVRMLAAAHGSISISGVQGSSAWSRASRTIRTTCSSARR